MSHTTSDRARSPLRALVVLNAGLLVVLTIVSLGAHAEAEAQPRGRGEYTMVAGGVNGSESSAAYIVDERNQELIAITFDMNSRTLHGITYRNLAADAANVARRTGN